jgi:hypothetical protein
MSDNVPIPETDVELWERQPWDTDLGYKVFQLWLKQDLPRNLDSAWREYKQQEYTPSGVRLKAPSYIKAMYDGHMTSQITGEYPTIGWEERVRKYDIDRQRKELVVWAERQRTVRNNEWDLADQLLKMAKKMLDWPIYEQFFEEGEFEGEKVQYLIIKPLKWGARDIAAIAKVASDLMRLSAEMVQGRYKMEMSINLSPEALEAIQVLEAHGLTVSDAVAEFENIIIETAHRYSVKK